MLEIHVSKNEAGQRFDKLLAKYLNTAPKSFFYKMLRKKNITLNDKKAVGNERLELNDIIKLYLSEETIAKFSQPYTISHTHINLDIIYENEHVLFINKPVGMLSQKAENTDESLVEHVISHLLDTGQITEKELQSFKPSVCNRLDRNTSGLVVAGKSLQGLQSMGKLFRTRELKKYYRCLVVGEVTTPQHILGYLVKDQTTNIVTISTQQLPESVPIETKYEPLWYHQGVTLLEVHLITGRTHQIRAHLASISHPIIGDYKYGQRRINEQYKALYGLQSQLLHAYRLELPKCTGVLASISEGIYTAPLPALFQQILEEKQ
ncbi:MAG: RluA family pseudouridine synthase [Lachnospiraceae bacterium]